MDGNKMILGLILVMAFAFFGCVAPPATPEGSNATLSQEDRYVSFSSAAEFGSYVSLRSSPQYYGGGREIAFDLALPTSAIGESVGKNAGTDSSAPSTGYSTTNVQIVGIDELDIMKNDGSNLFYARQGGYIYPYVDYYPYYRSKDTIYVINSSPLEIKEEIDENNILGIYLDEDSVIVARDDKIVSYTKDGEKEWSIRYPNESYYLESRQLGNKIYLMTRNYVNDGFEPRPFYAESGGADAEYRIGYGSIWYNPYVEEVNSMITVVKIDTGTGDIDEDASFIVNEYNMKIYMSRDNLYLANSVYKDTNSIMLDFLLSDGKDLVSESTYERLNELKGYDISDQSLTFEVMRMVNKEFKDESYTDMENDFRKYVEKNLEKVEYTTITRIGLDNLGKEAEGKVGGHPLNQFSMDEYKNNLRVATTYNGQGSSSSFSKVYVLDPDMDRIGESKKMGETERIYSVRFVNDKGYVVTFRQTDPLYVMDLSDPEDPEITGELKIPGYSSYLHPITKDGKELVLGIGMQDWKLKVSLFDVTDPENPEEVDSYLLNDWSDANYDHHAFLYDDRKGYAFIPGSQKMYVFSIGEDISLAKSIKVDAPKRAAYIGDIAYIFTDGRVLAYNEKDWSKEDEIDLWEDEIFDRPIAVY